LPFVLLICLLRWETGKARSQPAEVGWHRKHVWRRQTPRLSRPWLCTEAHWPASVTELAEAFAAGADCGCALHDALLEAGHPEMATYFSASGGPGSHWAVDRILGRCAETDR
jgi:hypothetical protein